MRIGLIGTGIMGKPMALNLMKSGYEMHFYARNKARCEQLIAQGAVFHETVQDLVKSCRTVITIVGYPQDVESLYLGEQGLLASAEKGTYLIDMTTSSPTLAERLHELGKEKGLHVLDAPVTGGEKGAKEASLCILAGGNKADFDSCLPVFQMLGQNIHYQGKAGSGQRAKLANQIMIAGTMAGICEAFTYAKAEGLNLQTLFYSVCSGAAASRQLNFAAPAIIAGDDTPSFFMKHFIKDMKLASQEAAEKHLNLNVLHQVLANYSALEPDYGNSGTQALMKYYERKEDTKHDN